MLRAIIVLAVIIVALVRGGSLLNLVALRVRAIPLVLAGFAIQLLIFTPFTGKALVPIATAPLYMLSMGLLVIWVVLNRQLPGILLIGAGVVMNTLAIAANGGLMPVDPDAAAYAGRLAGYDDAAIDNNSLASAEGVRLWLLTDIFPVPAGIPFANVFSLGDILLTTGIAVLCYQSIRARPTGEAVDVPGSPDAGQANRSAPAPSARLPEPTRTSVVDRN
ncbi:MAG: DUF5317 domain-containing protein [Chloroflexi bacterium OHK40]